MCDLVSSPPSAWQGQLPSSPASPAQLLPSSVLTPAEGGLASCSGVLTKLESDFISSCPGEPGPPWARRQASAWLANELMLPEFTTCSVQASRHAHDHTCPCHRRAPRGIELDAHCANEKTEAWVGKVACRTAQSGKQRLGLKSRRFPMLTVLAFKPCFSCLLLGANDSLTKLKIQHSP